MGLPLGTDALRAGGGVIAFARHPGFSSQSRSKTPAPIRVDFYIGSTSPYAQSALFCLGAGSGIPPAAAPSFRGVKKEKLHEIIRIEPSGQGISPEPCTTHGFGVGGSAGSRTQMSAVMSRALLPIEIRNHTAACRSRRKYPDCMLRHTRASTALPEPIPIAGCGYPLAGQAGFEPAQCLVYEPDALPFKLLSHITAGYGSTPAGGLCLLSAEID